MGGGSKPCCVPCDLVLPWSSGMAAGQLRGAWQGWCWRMQVPTGKGPSAQETPLDKWGISPRTRKGCVELLTLPKETHTVRCPYTQSYIPTHVTHTHTLTFIHFHILTFHLYIHIHKSTVPLITLSLTHTLTHTHTFIYSYTHTFIYPHSHILICSH